MGKIVISLLPRVFFSLNSGAQCKLDYSNYHLVFEENFDSIISPSQLSNRWMFHPDDPGWGWGDSYDTTNHIWVDGEYYDQSQVSVIPGGILRLTAVRLDQLAQIQSSWYHAEFLNRNRNTPERWCRYKSGMIQLRRDVSGAPFEGCNDFKGFTYGMFEVRMKIPKGVTYPAFWLIGPTQFNIFEGKFDSRKYGVGFDDEWTTDPVTNKHPSRSLWMNKLNWDDLADNFHTYTGVWTNNIISFFLDGREICTYTGDIVNSLQWHGGWCEANSNIVSMQMPGYSTESSCNLDIDYIKVFKPIHNDYTLGYKSSNEQMNHDVFAGINPVPTTVSYESNSIAPNTNNANELFYRGSNDYIFVATKIGNTWQVKRLEYNDGSPSLAAGDVRYLPIADIVLYVGANQRINLFGRSNSELCGFYHWYLRNDWWNGDYDKVYPQAGALQTAPNGDIFFKGMDSKKYRYYFSGGIWNHQVFNHPNSNSLVGGDIVINPSTYNVFYRGTDNRLQTFWKDNSGNYNQAWVDTNWNNSAYNISSTPGSIVFAPSVNGVLYIGSDNKIQLYSWSTYWSHSWIPYSYGNPNLGYINGDYAKSSIDWDNTLQRLYYAGFDGRIQQFGKSGSSWWHSWVDDYWNTDEYATFNSSYNINWCASLKLGFDSGEHSKFYVRNDNHLSYFRYEPCEVLNPVDTVWRNLNKQLITTSINKMTSFLYPNPVHDKLTNKNINSNSVPNLIKIYDVTGKLILLINPKNNTTEIDFSSINCGIYLAEIIIGKYVEHKKIVKN